MTNEPASPATEMATAYDPSQVEERVYEAWEQAGAFQPQGGERPFTIIMPPPNLTGELHIGHALTVAVEDALVRWHRMLGDDTLWLPGVDHAAIAVNALVERELAAEGISRHDIGREAFLERVWQFVGRSRSRIEPKCIPPTTTSGSSLACPATIPSHSRRFSPPSDFAATDGRGSSS